MEEDVGTGFWGDEAIKDRIDRGGLAKADKEGKGDALLAIYEDHDQFASSLC